MPLQATGSASRSHLLLLCQFPNYQFQLFPPRSPDASKICLGVAAIQHTESGSGGEGGILIGGNWIYGNAVPDQACGQCFFLYGPGEFIPADYSQITPVINTILISTRHNLEDQLANRPG